MEQNIKHLRADVERVEKTIDQANKIAQTEKQDRLKEKEMNLQLKKVVKELREKLKEKEQTNAPSSHDGQNIVVQNLNNLY